MLDYDNSAFYYFALTLLSLYLIPGTYYFLSELYRAFLGNGDTGSIPRSSEEALKAEKLKKKSTGFARLQKSTFVINFVILLVVGMLVFYLVTLVRNDGEVNTFDPYIILGLDSGTTLSEIKKAYRKLSLKYHPDKNIGDKVAEEMFMKIAKAYEALTDETSKENYEKYGNPDGKQALEVSIGLPRIILDNPKSVLVLYLIAMVIIIPVVVGWWYSNSKKFGDKNILYDTYAGFYQLLTENDKIKHLPEIMATSAECREISKKVNPKTKDADNEALLTLYNKFKSEKLISKPKFDSAQYSVILKGNLLMHSYLLRINKNTLTPQLKNDLELMLIKGPELIEGMIEISYQRKWVETTIQCIKLSQCLIQGLWYNNSPFDQLPHLNGNLESSFSSSTFQEFLKAYENDKVLKSLKSEQVLDIKSAIKIFPNLNIKTELFVEEDDNDFFDDDEIKENNNSTSDSNDNKQPYGDEIYEQDLVTLRITLIHENVENGQNCPPVHAPLFPKTVLENWWFILTDKPSKISAVTNNSGVPIETQIHAIEKVSDQSKKIVHELRFVAPPQPGNYDMDLYIFSDCYMGLDNKISLNFDVKPASELPEYKPHQEDLDLDNEPTLFEQVMAANIDEESSDDDDDDDDDKANEKLHLKGSDNTNKSPIIVDNDEDSEED